MQPVEIADIYRFFDNHTYYAVIEKLRQYGLDIRRYKVGFWWLVGRETEDGKYIDFIAAQFEEQMDG
jgi:hypothetical protein